MEAMRSLLDPKAVAVVGASQRRGRGTNVIANLRDCGFAGEIFAVNPRYQDVLGYKCFPTVSDLPASVDCLVVAVAADAACDVLEEAHARGITAAIVLAAGFGEGGHGHARAARLRSLADRGMCICGPNCFGLISVKTGFAAYSGPLSRPLRAGPVAIVSQSGGLGANVFAPLMTDRELGFSHFVSCGNQIGATVEDYIEYFIDDPDITVIAAVIEQLKNPRKLISVAAIPPMRDANPWCCFRPGARRPARSWCNPIPGRSPAMPKFSPRSCAAAASSRSSVTMNSSRPSNCSRSLHATKRSEASSW